MTVNFKLMKTGEGTPSVTGFFEVEVLNGKLLHSKKVIKSSTFSFSPL